MNIFNSKGQTAGAAVMGGGFVATILHFFRDPKVMLWLLGGILVAALIVGLVLLIVKWRKRKKGDQGTKGLLDLLKSDDVPADRRQELADLERKLNEGVEKLKGLKMNLYDKPWYVIIGEPGSGKSEAIRQCLEPHCPPSLQDPLQGTGGTINMDWWFTNYAIMLDTAGEMTVPDAEAGAGQKWREFLGYLSKFRPHEPINGIFLAIPADSLVMDDDEKVRSKARHISQRLNEVQSRLDVRVPVYVMITKADLIVGFREFFSNLVSGSQQDQLFGWCNPDPLDQAFDATKLRDYLSNLVNQVSARRMALLDQAAGDEQKRLQAATLYAFPYNLQAVTETLGSYLQMIFPPPGPDGKVLGQKPLFVRGVFFTSSLQKGAPLDRAVMELVPKMRENTVDREVRKRSYFLADLFIEKAFREFGLVTNASNARRKLRVRQIIMLCTIIFAVTVLIGFTWYGGQKLETAIGRHRALWTQVKDKGWDRDHPEFWRPILRHRNVGGELLYDDSEPIELGAKSYDTLGYLQALHDLANTPIQIPKIFRISGRSADDAIQPKMLKSAAALYDSVVTKPLVQHARERFDTEELAWNASHTAVLRNLLSIEYAHLLPEQTIEKDESKSKVSDPDTPPASFDTHFFDVLLEADERAKAATQEEQLAMLHSYYYNNAPWPPSNLATKECTLHDDPVLEAGVEHFAKYALEFEELSQLQKAIENLKAMQAELTAEPTADVDTTTPAEVTKNISDLLAFEKTSIVDLKSNWLDDVEQREEVDELPWWGQLAAFDIQAKATSGLIDKLNARHEDLLARKTAMLEQLGAIAKLAENIASADTAPTAATPDSADDKKDEVPKEEKEDVPAPKAEPTNPLLLSFRDAMKGCEVQMGKRLAELELPNLSEAEDAECQVELLTEIDAYFKKRLEKASKESLDLKAVEAPVEAVDLQLAKLTEALKAAQDSYAGVETRRQQMYQRVLDAKAKTDPIEEFKDMAPALRALCESISKAKAEVNQAAGKDEFALMAAKRSNELLDLIYRSRGSAIAESGLEKLADLEIAKLVESRAGKLEPVKDDPLPWDDFDLQFHPRATALLFGELAQITNPKFACESKLLNARELDDLYDDIQKNIEGYIEEEFVEYWSVGAKKVFAEDARKLNLDQRFPEIHFMSEDLAFKPEFHTLAAKGIRAAFTICQDAVADDAVKTILTDALIDHAAEHLGYWTDFIDQRRHLDAPSTKWADLSSEFSVLRRRAYRVHDGIKEMVEYAEAALQVVSTPIEESYADDAEVLKNERRDAIEALAILEETRETLESDNFRRDVKDVLAGWSDLSRDPAKARLTLLSLPANKLADYLIDWEYDRGDLVREYWRDVIIMAFNSLQDPDAVSCMDDIKPKLGFPIRFRSASDLSKRELEDVRDLLIPCQPCQTGDETVRCNDVKVPEAERAIVKLRPQFSDSDRRFIERANGVIDAALAVSSCVVKLKDQTTQASLPTPAFLQWHEIKFAKGNRYKTANSEDIVLDELTLPGSGIEIALYQFPGDANPKRKFTLASPWQALRFLFPGQVAHDGSTMRWGLAQRSGDGKRFTVKLQITDQAGAARPLVLEFAFSKPLPDLGEWPE